MSTPANPPLPRSGDELLLDRRASVQFREPILFRVIRVHDWPCTLGWVWLDGFEIGENGDAVERRTLFVQVAALPEARAAVERGRAAARQAAARRVGQARNARVPGSGSAVRRVPSRR